MPSNNEGQVAHVCKMGCMTDHEKTGQDHCHNNIHWLLLKSLIAKLLSEASNRDVQVAVHLYVRVICIISYTKRTISITYNYRIA